MNTQFPTVIRIAIFIIFSCAFNVFWFPAIRIINRKKDLKYCPNI